jgi:hypothetical protein
VTRATLSTLLLVLSTVVFAVTGLGYLVAPGLMLAVVGIESGATADFLLRTEGVALLCGAGLLWAARGSATTPRRIALVSLGAYYIIGSIVDAAAFLQGVVGPASVPSVAVRIVLGVFCLFSAAGTPDSMPQSKAPEETGPRRAQGSSGRDPESGFDAPTTHDSASRA